MAEVQTRLSGTKNMSFRKTLKNFLPQKKKSENFPAKKGSREGFLFLIFPV